MSPRKRDTEHVFYGRQLFYGPLLLEGGCSPDQGPTAWSVRRAVYPREAAVPVEVKEIGMDMNIFMACTVVLVPPCTWPELSCIIPLLHSE